jgi:hypothetical protein
MVGTLIELTMLALAAQAYLDGDYDQARHILAQRDRTICRVFRTRFVSARSASIGDSWLWMEGLRARGATALRIAYFPTNRLNTARGSSLSAYHFDHRFGGMREFQGGHVIEPPNPAPWAIIISLPGQEEHWWPHSEFIRDSTGNSGHWRVTYTLGPGSSGRPRLPEIEDARADLIQALEAIIAYNGSGSWTDQFFAPALAHLAGDPAVPGETFADELNIPDGRAELLRAVSRGWVFGGMGSWNDSGPLDRGSEDEYESVTSNLYTDLCFAIVAAVNHGQPEART